MTAYKTEPLTSITTDQGEQMNTATKQRWATNIDLDLIDHREALNMREAALVAGIGLSTLYNLVGKNQGPKIVRNGKRRRILREDLLNWLKDNYEEPRPKVA